jgi:hypothetical protein
MGRDNTSSIDSGNGHKLAALASQQKAAVKGQFEGKSAEQKEQIVNARKAANVAAAKAKAKKRAKLAKASKKKNKR